MPHAMLRFEKLDNINTIKFYLLSENLRLGQNDSKLLHFLPIKFLFFKIKFYILLWSNLLRLIVGSTENVLLKSQISRLRNINRSETEIHLLKMKLIRVCVIK